MEKQVDAVYIDGYSFRPKGSKGIQISLEHYFYRRDDVKIKINIDLRQHKKMKRVKRVLCDKN